MTLSQRPSESQLSEENIGTSAPYVSVILPVFNGVPYLGLAIESILDQEYRDFELIIVDDGSTDDSWDVINSYKDPRIVQLRHTNIGLPATLNQAIHLSRGRLIARQDQDDISRPTRLARQVRYLTDYPEVAMCGTWASVVDENGVSTRLTIRPPSNSSLLVLEMLFENYIPHSSVVARRSVLLDLGGYPTDPSVQPPEDYVLWSRMLEHEYRISAIEEPLLIFRQNSKGMSRSASAEWRRRADCRAYHNRRWFIEATRSKRSRTRIGMVESSKFQEQHLHVIVMELVQIALGWSNYAKSQGESVQVVYLGYRFLLKILLKTLLRWFGLLAPAKRLASALAALTGRRRRKRTFR